MSVNNNRQRSSEISIIKARVLGPAHACACSPVISVQETKSRDVPNLELLGYVCYGGKFWVRNVVGCQISFAQLGDHGSLKRDVQQFSPEPLW